MPEQDERNGPDGVSSSRLAAAMMVVGGVILALVATVWAIARCWEISQAARPSVAEFVAAAGLLLAAWGFGLLLWGMAELLRRLEDLVATLRANPSAGAVPVALPAPRARPMEGRAESHSPLLEEMVHLLREMRDIELLSESERALRLQVESQELVRQLEIEVPALLREHDLPEAELRLQRARRRFPNLPNWSELSQHIEQARAKFEAHDLATAAREVDDLIALGAWDRVSNVVRGLRTRHPQSEQVAELGRRAALAQERATAEERARLMSQAQEATNNREWPRALELVQQVIARFPGSPEARDLRLQLATLRANVEIYQRQELEAKIRELIKAHEFPEALRLAHLLIERFPGSPQAQVLREQLDRLQEKAAAGRAG